MQITKKKELNKLEKQFLFIRMLGNKHLRVLPFKVLLRIYIDFTNFRITAINNQYLVHSFMPPFPGKAFDNCLKAWKNHQDALFNAHISVTNRCEYDCDFCSNYYKKGQEMSLEQIQNLIKKLQGKNVSTLAFTGGDPLIRKDLAQIIESVGENTTTYVFSSGKNFTKEKAIELKNAGLFGIAISFDSYKPEIHEESRNFKGAFDIALNAVEIAKESGFYVIAQIVISKKNIDNIYEFLTFLKKLGVDEVRVLQLFSCGRIVGEKEDLLNEEELRKLKELHHEASRNKDLPKTTTLAFIESEDYFGCMAGYNTLYVSANGDICPCDMTPISFGSVMNEEFELIWSRLKKVFTAPSTGCFIQNNADKIAGKFKGQFPLPYEDSKEISEDYKPKKSAKYFQLLKK